MDSSQYVYAVQAADNASNEASAVDPVSRGAQPMLGLLGKDNLTFFPKPTRVSK